MLLWSLFACTFAVSSVFASAGESCAAHAHLANYSCDATTCQGYLAHPKACTSQSKCPAVVVIQDWNGMNEYEMERARMLADLGYVGFAADIYGLGTPVENMGDWAAAAGKHRRNVSPYMTKIRAAVDKVKAYDFVDTSKIAVIGYCFGGTGVVNMALLGEDVLGVVGYHSGIAPNSRAKFNASSGVKVTAKVLLHSGVKDDEAVDIATLEEELESAGATYEIDRYGSGVYHSFTEWSSNVPNMAMYDQRSDVRSWTSTKHFLKELFEGLPAADRSHECNDDPKQVSSAPEVQLFGLFWMMPLGLALWARLV
eukprot:TRINITY_DN309_c0_g1_i1.p1 TRINITY_DN309_c0_g1~~TRINITY_DN309_c0_g1_i1.p1  ORF type:complete len:312 (-),score=67.51 TRINITY_DN309_c0_g1_i1:287-1222(-)